MRCGNPVHFSINVGVPGSGPIDVGVCAEHHAEIGQGARWLYEYEEGNEGRLGRLLMGRDMPPRAAKAAVRGLLSADGIVRLFTFEVENPDGSQHEYEFELSAEIADGVWQILGRGRGEAGRPGAGPR